MGEQKLTQINKRDRSRKLTRVPPQPERPIAPAASTEEEKREQRLTASVLQNHCSFKKLPLRVAPEQHAAAHLKYHSAAPLSPCSGKSSQPLLSSPRAPLASPLHHVPGVLFTATKSSAGNS